MSSPDDTTTEGDLYHPDNEPLPWPENIPVPQAPKEQFFPINRAARRAAKKAKR